MGVANKDPKHKVWAIYRPHPQCQMGLGPILKGGIRGVNHPYPHPNIKQEDPLHLPLPHIDQDLFLYVDPHLEFC